MNRCLSKDETEPANSNFCVVCIRSMKRSIIVESAVDLYVYHKAGSEYPQIHPNLYDLRASKQFYIPFKNKYSAFKASKSLFPSETGGSLLWRDICLRIRVFIKMFAL
jgi:hypothetical protein